MLPDADTIGFAFGVPYGSTWGHRGAAHSLAIAMIVGLVAGLLARRMRTAAFVAAVVASHGLLDTFTDGGLGVALFWPLSRHRYFAPWRPIPVAPIGTGMLSRRGLSVMAVEAILFLPFALYALWPRRAAPQNPDPAR